MSHFTYLDEFLDSHSILSELDQVNQARLNRLEIFDTIDSTNAYLLQQVRRQPVSGWVCFAETQVQGRGRLGREWYSPRSGNLYCSMTWCVEQQQEVANLSLAVAVIILRTLKKYGVTQEVGVKWPNDLLFSGKKLAGILLERSGETIVIGIGINILLPDKSLSSLIQQAIGLAEITGHPVQRNRLAGLLVNELLTQLPIYAKEGLQPYLHEWRQHDELLGKMIHVSLPDRQYTGKMCGISDAGELLLEDEKGIMHALCSGEATLSKGFL